jgi:ferredoxin--NADP+ reductase
VAIIGNGNVALDVARLLAKSADEMAKSDIVPEAGAAIAAAPLTDLYVVGRRGPENASFTNAELAEMGRLARAVAVTDAQGLDVAPPAGESTPDRLRKSKNLQILRGFSHNQPGSKPVTLHFMFHAAPLAFAPGEVTLTTGKLAADFCVTCIGYSGEDFPRRPEFFPVGWAKRGPTGTIPTNRAESLAVAKEVLAWLADRDPRSGPDILPTIVDAAGWHRIDKHEIAAAADTGRPRVKLTDWQALLDVAQGA